MLEKTEEAIKNGQSRETGNKMKKNKTKTQHSIYWTPQSTFEYNMQSNLL
jgi:hypothetical protein